MQSLPLIPPRADGSLWPGSRASHIYLDIPSNDTYNSTANNTGARNPNSQHGNQNPNSAFMAALIADENNIRQRKQNIRKFGAGWLRPPGVAKTYQAKMDEDYEREEQEMLARREQVLLDLAAAQTDAANQEEAAQGDDEMMEGERDLDDEVPEAEADDSDVSSTEEEASDVEEDDTSALGPQAGDVTFNEDSFIEGSMMQAEVEHMLEREEAEMAGVLQDERDLDDDIPEAGSYEHTDTDLDSSDEDLESSRISVRSIRSRRSARRSSGVRSSAARVTRSQRNSAVMAVNNRGSFGMDGSSSIMDGSSFLRSSPAAGRGNLRSRFMGAR
ncbi:hypothetical protein BU24DRAFT_422951 [Aaosphaeria arxii CBS 175.79]|uniref:Uncharacterized protein n=1 Tax=Aaosphaeria arxii CBS 175.79 TaxID=1450172 RepID=A0A6A5XTF6_9PLEO|nr:uncharacterized protein BU24DRAFT_422951 [Aaosphaeria arxii CBS 175.79]KAF2016578.1 hypothetical protein BU24DRAFT_422951 [Aaosphaeria arxii CBS 175.79]